MKGMYDGKEAGLTEEEITQILEEHKNIKVKRSTILAKEQLNKVICAANRRAQERLSIVAGFPPLPKILGEQRLLKELATEVG